MCSRSVYILVLVWICNSNCQNSFFKARKHQDFNYVCITNSSFALSWIIDDIQETLKQASNYIPRLQGNSFIHDITNDHTTENYYAKDGWSLIKSLESNINGLILDQRWEDMEVVKTTGTEETLNYTTVISTLKNDFEIPLSVRAEKEAHIFLCDGAFPPRSNCYWFMLQIYGGIESAIQKCKKQDILVNNVYSKESCKLLIRKNHSYRSFNYLSNKYWSHFKLSRKDDHLSFTKFDGKTEKTILEFQDKDINITHMVVHSKVVNALWKIHQLDFIYTNKEAQDIALGPPIAPMNNAVCISMFISMCDSCRLKLKIITTNTTKEIIYTMYQHSRWSEIKFSADNVQDDEIQLLVSTIGTSPERFWAIDKVRSCQKNVKAEIRMITLTKEAQCQLMTTEKNVIAFKNIYNTIESECPEDTIGEFCVPCKWIYDDCNRIKICSRTRETETKCFCSAGFKNFWNCEYECNSGYYGHGCQKRCGKCPNNSCNYMNGTCSSCIENFCGPKCEIPPATMFAKAPGITNLGYTTVTIHVNNFQVQFVVNNDQPAFYAIQYMKAHSDNWINFGTNYTFYESKFIKINQLEADTEYHVRCIIITEKRKTHISPQIPVATFITRCQELSENNIDVKPSNTSVNMSLIETTEISCKFSKYSIMISNIGNPRLSNSSNVFFDKLTPFTNYTVSIQNNWTKLEKTFQTTEGIPYRVRNFVVINKTSSSVALQWHKSTKIYGKLKHHILEYQLLSNVACNFSTNFSSKSLEVNGTFATVKNLLPYSLYSFSVSTVNTKITGRPQILEVATLPANSIHNDEIPEIIAIEPSVVPNEATIKLSRVNCTKIRGPLLVKITPSCFNKWGKRHKAKTYQLPKTELLLNELTPFSDYRLKMKFCRNETNCDNVVESHTFKTAPGVPHAVKDLLVYSKNESTIYLRWKPPYPPTGILDYFYNVRYGVFGGSLKDEKDYRFYKRICKLWREFHCGNLTNLANNTKFTIKIFAKNKFIYGPGRGVTINVTTKTEPSEPPYDLKIVWTEENDLKLQWKHPNQSNGEIQYFKIEAIPPYYARELKIEKQLPITAYNLTYHYKIETQDLLPSTRYRINVAAFNGYFGKPVTVMDTSPPDIPSINGDLHTESSNHSITIEIQTKSGQDYDTYYGLILLISDEHVNVKSYPGLENFDLKNFRIVSKCKLINFDHVYRFIIGDNSQQKHCDGKMENPPLSGGTSYNVTVILTNTFQNKIRYNLYSRICNTTGDTMKKEDSNSNLLALLSLIFIIPTVAIIIFCILSKTAFTVAISVFYYNRNNHSN